MYVVNILSFIKEKLQHLPSLPDVVLRIMDIIDDPKTSIKQVNELICLDEGLSAQVLRLVNSAYYGLPQPVTAIRQGIVILGLSAVANLVLGISVAQLLSGRHTGPERQQVWKHSVSAAIGSRLIARRRRGGPKAEEEAFMAGLLHNIGELFLISFFAGPMQEVRSVQRQQSIPDYEAEQVILGAPHTLIGQWIALHWNLPPVFAAVAEQHHRPDPDDEYFATVAAVHAADILCNPEADEEEWLDAPFDASVEAYLGLSEEDRRTLRERYVSELASAEAFLNLSA